MSVCPSVCWRVIVISMSVRLYVHSFSILLNLVYASPLFLWNFSTSLTTIISWMSLQFTHVTHILVLLQWFSLIFIAFYIFNLVYASPPSLFIRFLWNFTTSLTTMISWMSLQFTHVTKLPVLLQWFSLIFTPFLIFNLVLYASTPFSSDFDETSKHG